MSNSSSSGVARNDFERSLMEQIEEAEGVVMYETTRIDYTKHNGKRGSYYPDFILCNGLIVEAKGQFRLEDRRKHLRIKEQRPELDVRIVFQDARLRLRTGKPTTYAQWCRRHGIQYAEKTIPAGWFAEERRSDPAEASTETRNKRK